MIQPPIEFEQWKTSSGCLPLVNENGCYEIRLENIVGISRIVMEVIN